MQWNVTIKVWVGYLSLKLMFEDKIWGLTFEIMFWNGVLKFEVGYKSVTISFEVWLSVWNWVLNLKFNVRSFFFFLTNSKSEVPRWDSKYGPQVPKEWFESIYPLILWQSKTEWKLIADLGLKWRCWFINHYCIQPKHHTTQQSKL